MKTLLKLAAVGSVTALMLLAVAACAKNEDGRANAGAGDIGAKAGETHTTAAVVVARASCNMTTQLGTCNEYRHDGAGTGAANALTASRGFGLEKSLCEGFHGHFANTGCSTDGQLGSCVMTDGEVKRYYGTQVAGEHALTLDEAKSDCESESVKGRFTADPTGEKKNEATR